MALNESQTRSVDKRKPFDLGEILHDSTEGLVASGTTLSLAHYFSKVLHKSHLLSALASCDR